jgi:hypothetical protein
MGIGANRKSEDEASWRGGREYENLLARLNQTQKTDSSAASENEAEQPQSDAVDEPAEATLEDAPKASGKKEKKKRKRSEDDDTDGDVDRQEAKRRRKEEKKARKAKDKREKKEKRAAKKLKMALNETLTQTTDDLNVASTTVDKITNKKAETPAGPVIRA